MSAPGVEIGFRRARWHDRRDARFIIFVVIVVGLYYGQGYALGPGRITDDLHAAIDGGDERFNIVITTNFPAEEFHFSIFQRIGSIRGGQGNDMELHQVRSKHIRMLSRKYWVDHISLAPSD